MPLYVSFCLPDKLGLRLVKRSQRGQVLLFALCGEWVYAYRSSISLCSLSHKIFGHASSYLCCNNGNTPIKCLRLVER